MKGTDWEQHKNKTWGRGDRKGTLLLGRARSPLNHCNRCLRHRVATVQQIKLLHPLFPYIDSFILGRAETLFPCWSYNVYWFQWFHN